MERMALRRGEEKIIESRQDNSMEVSVWVLSKTRNLMDKHFFKESINRGILFP